MRHGHCSLDLDDKIRPIPNRLNAIYVGRDRSLHCVVLRPDAWYPLSDFKTKKFTKSSQKIPKKKCTKKFQKKIEKVHTKFVFKKKTVHKKVDEKKFTKKFTKSSSKKFTKTLIFLSVANLVRARMRYIVAWRLVLKPKDHCVACHCPYFKYRHMVALFQWWIIKMVLTYALLKYDRPLLATLKKISVKIISKRKFKKKFIWILFL